MFQSSRLVFKNKENDLQKNNYKENDLWKNNYKFPRTFKIYMDDLEVCELLFVICCAS